MSSERQPSYLEQDSPAINGNPFMLEPSDALFQISATKLNTNDLKLIPKSPRSKRLESIIRMKEKVLCAERAELKEEEMELKTKMTFISKARATVAEQLRHPKSQRQASLNIVFEEPQMEQSLTAPARAFLATSSNPARTPDTKTARVVADKVAGLRAAAHSGAVQLDALRHHAPKIPKPSTLSSRQAALETAAAAQQQEEEEARQELRRREEEEKEREPDPPIRHFVIAGVAVNYLQLVAKRYAITKSIHRYMHDPVAIAELVRLQRWVRHQRLKKVFFKLLRHRRIVIKALIRYALRFQVRYKHRCANMVLNFFQTCFDEAGFRMAMKIFIFRVVRTQRVMRTFLVCTRARQEAMRQRLEAHPELWEGDPKRERTAHYICAVCPSLLLPIIRRYRRPFMAARTVYRRSLKAGDLTPAFQSLTTNSIRSFLANPQAAALVEPPQYAGGKLRPPVFVMNSHEALLEDFAALLDKHEKRARFHERKMAQEAEDRRRQAEMEDAVRRGKGHEYELAQMQQRVQEEEPSDRFAKAVEELNGFERWKTRQARKRVAAVAAEERDERQTQLALAKLHAGMPKKIL